MTPPTRYHLAQANVALGLAPLDDPVMQGFVEQLDYINSVADRADGFVWRYQTADGDATATRVLDDPLIVLWWIPVRHRPSVAVDPFVSLTAGTRQRESRPRKR